MTTNADMVKLWNSDAAQSWWTRPERYDAMIGPFGDLVLSAAGLQPGEGVLDVGCGAGQLTTQAAAAVGSAGRVVGLDISRELLAVAGRRAAESGLAQVELVQADAQTHAFSPPSFDVVISRFGVMFFADPVAAFRNLHGATRPGGRLAFVCWQDVLSNDWALVPTLAMGPHVGFPEPPAPGAPSPFAFSDVNRVRQILADAGWSDVALEDVKTTVTPGGARDADDAVAFFTDDVFGHSMLANAEPAQQEAARDALRAEYDKRNGPEGIRLNAAVWIVTASRG